MFSFGKLPTSSFDLPYSMGTNAPGIDDARAARTRGETIKYPKAGQPVAKAATNKLPLSFGTAVPKMSDTFSQGTKVSFPKSIGKKKNPFGFGTDADSFFSLASFGQSVDDTRSNNSVYDDAILRRSRVPQPIPTVHTARIDGGTKILSTLKGLAAETLKNMGSSGDGDLVPVSYTTQGSQTGGFNPLWIAGAAVAAGAIYYVASK